MCLVALTLFHYCSQTGQEKSMRVRHAFLAIAAASTVAVLSATAHATTLTPGDVAIVEAQGTGDSFSWVALTDITAGSSLSWTDEGWLAAGGFRGAPTGESGQPAITISSNITAGTVTTVTLASGLGNTGESVMLFTGTAPTANPGTGLLWGINWGNAGWAADAAGSDTSALPAALADYNTAVTPAPGDVYDGPTTGTQAELIADIANASNWTSYSGNTWPGVGGVTNFTVNSVPEPASLGVLGLGLTGLLARRRRQAK
jgi:hypothetical protein